MARVEAVVDEIEMEGDYGNMVPGLSVSCPICGHEVEVYGTSEASAMRGGATLAEECPQGLRNFYVAVGGDYDDAEVYHDYEKAVAVVEKKVKRKPLGRRSWGGFVRRG